RVAIVGCGRAGTALALALAHARGGGRPRLTISSRRVAAARSLARRCPGARAAGSREDAIAAADVVVLAVHDDALAELARDLRRAPGLPGRIVLHLSGSVGPSVLRPLARRGASVGALHPLIVFPPALRASTRLAPRPIGFTVDGDRRARAAGRALV